MRGFSLTYGPSNALENLSLIFPSAILGQQLSEKAYELLNPWTERLERARRLTTTT
jgi:hypothetical protein